MIKMIRKFTTRLERPSRHGEKGFTLIELLIVIAVLGALAAVVVPAVTAFLSTANLAAANTEAANVKTAAMSYLADNGVFPNVSGVQVGAGNQTVALNPVYLGKAPDGSYVFGIESSGAANNNTDVLPAGALNGILDTAGAVNGASVVTATGGAGITSGLAWNCRTQSWVKTALVNCP